MSSGQFLPSGLCLQRLSRIDSSLRSNPLSAFSTSSRCSSKPELVIRARNADIFTIPLLWVVGNAKKAEESFFESISRLLLLNYFKAVLAAIAKGQTPEEVAASLQASDEFRYLKEIDEEDDTARAEFSAAVKTLTFVREAIKGAITCKNCHARIAPGSISYDHIVRVQDGGIGTPDNAQMMHPCCNSGYKESGGKPIPPLS